jgi:hypothetical protein
MNRRQFVKSLSFGAAALVLPEILAGKFANGDKIKVDASSHKFTFEKNLDQKT